MKQNKIQNFSDFNNSFYHVNNWKYFNSLLMTLWVVDFIDWCKMKLGKDGITLFNYDVWLSDRRFKKSLIDQLRIVKERVDLTQKHELLGLPREWLGGARYEKAEIIEQLEKASSWLNKNTDFKKKLLTTDNRISLTFAIGKMKVTLSFYGKGPADPSGHRYLLGVSQQYILAGGFLFHIDPDIKETISTINLTGRGSVFFSRAAKMKKLVSNSEGNNFRNCIPDIKGILTMSAANALYHSFIIQRLLADRSAVPDFSYTKRRINIVVPREKAQDELVATCIQNLDFQKKVIQDLRSEINDTNQPLQKVESMIAFSLILLYFIFEPEKIKDLERLVTHGQVVEKLNRFILAIAGDNEEFWKFLEKEPAKLNLLKKNNPTLYQMVKDKRASAEKWKTDLSADLGELGF